MSEETCNFTIEIKDAKGRLIRTRCTKPKDHLDHEFEVPKK